jgi:hypothetical protein
MDVNSNQTMDGLWQLPLCRRRLVRLLSTQETLQINNWQLIPRYYVKKEPSILEQKRINEQTTTQIDWPLVETAMK